ncbi:MAG: Dabb family protein [Ideonella sp.]|nr:Dabb family protein [Ideonella sp.]
MSAIRHIVMWTLADATSAVRFKAQLDSCRRLVPGIVEWEVGIRQPGLDASVDVVLVSTFDSREALEAYQNHPHHKAVAALIGPWRRTRDVLDYDIDAARSAAAAVPPAGEVADPPSP